MSNPTINLIPPKNFHTDLPTGTGPLLESFLRNAGLRGAYTFRGEKKVHGSSGRSGTVRFVNAQGRCRVTVQPGRNDSATEGYLTGKQGMDLWSPLEKAYPENVFPPKKEETVTGQSSDFAMSAASVAKTVAEAGSIMAEYKGFEEALVEIYEQKQKLHTELERIKKEIATLERDAKEHADMLSDAKFLGAKDLIETLRGVLS